MTESSQHLVHVSDKDVEGLIEGYLARRKDDVIAARAALDDEAFDRLVLLGHNLHGSGGAYGIPQVSRIGRDLEQAARVEDPVAIRESLAQLEDLLARIRIV